jgi:hypothetical protein
MLFISRLPVAEQAQCLVSSLAEHRSTLDLARAQKLCLALAGREEKAAAKWLRHELAQCHIHIKHVHALRLIGLLAGRGGWYGANAAATAVYRLMLAGLDSPSGAEVSDPDPGKLLELMSAAAHGWATKVQSARVVTLRRAATEILLEQNALQEGGFMGLLKANHTNDWEAWIKFQNYAVERLRRALEENATPVFVDGMALALLPSAKVDGVRELAVHDGVVELGRGTDLHVLELMEAEAGEELMHAQVDGNSIRTASHTFYLMQMYRKLEPLLETEERSMFHPETELLLRQYQLFRRKLGQPLAPLKLSGRYMAPNGLPQEVPMNWEAVKATMVAAKLTAATVAQRAASTEVGDALMARRPLLGIVPFVQLASALGANDFNTLVRKATWSQAVPADEAALRSVLYGVDELRFVVGAGFSSAVDARLREACQELHASRKVREMQMSGAVTPPLDEMVFAHDGDEFLAVTQECDAEVRMQVVPTFLSAESLGLEQKFELPAVGRRLTLLTRPRSAVAVGAASTAGPAS